MCAQLPVGEDVRPADPRVEPEFDGWSEPSPPEVECDDREHGAPAPEVTDR